MLARIIREPRIIRRSAAVMEAALPLPNGAFVGRRGAANITPRHRTIANRTLEGAWSRFPGPVKRHDVETT